MPPVVASRLRAADARHFAGNDAYNRVARATCRADAAIARKELPECWAMAERIHDEFWRSAEPPRRVVDVAASATGCLAGSCWRCAPSARHLSRWSTPSTSACRPRRASSGTPSARPSRGCGRSTATVGDARDVVAAGDTLVCGLHACGGLSDIVIDVALEGSSAPRSCLVATLRKSARRRRAAAKVGLDEAATRRARGASRRRGGPSSAMSVLRGRSRPRTASSWLASAVAAVEPRPLYPRFAAAVVVRVAGSCLRGSDNVYDC